MTTPAGEAMTAGEIEYPEHEKVHEIKEQSQSIGEFLDWLFGKGVHLMTWEEWEEEENWGYETKMMKHSGFMGVRKSIDHLLAEYFEIDLKKLEEEKQEILQRIRMTQEAKK